MLSKICWRIEIDLWSQGLLIDAHFRDGKLRLYASGLRNAVGIAVNQQTGQLWATVNERDGIGDDVPSDYFTHVTEGGFYGWPYSYIGPHVDNRVSPRPDQVAKAIVPGVLLGRTLRRCSSFSTKDSNSLRLTDTVHLSLNTVPRSTHKKRVSDRLHPIQ